MTAAHTQDFLRVVDSQRLEASATKSVCGLNLDLVGMTVRSIEVNGARATWSPHRTRADSHPQRPDRIFP